MLIVAGDAHMGSSPGLGRLPDQQRSWELLCKVAVDQAADVIGSGDWFHHRRPSPADVDAFQSGLRILREGGRTFLTIVGNHEVQTVDAPSCLEVACAGFDAHVFRGPQVVDTEDGPVAFLPWAPHSGDARRTAEALLILAQQMAADGARVLVAHHSLSGASLPTGLPVLELAEPILDSFALAQMGFDVVLSGHIHKRQVIVEEPLVAHIGPLSRGHFGEAGVETGAWQVDFSAVGRGGMRASWFEVPDRAFVSVECDARGGDATAAVMACIAEADVDEAIVRVAWRQTADQSVNTLALLDLLAENGAHVVDRLEPIVERIQSTRSAGVTEASDPRESWDRWQEAQAEFASEETLATAREQAHERIGAAA